MTPDPHRMRGGAHAQSAPASRAPSHRRMRRIPKCRHHCRSKGRRKIDGRSRGGERPSMGPGRPDIGTILNPSRSTGEDIAESCDEFDNRFRIRVASKARLRSRASSLIERRYAWRGYSTSPLRATPAARSPCAPRSTRRPSRRSPRPSIRRRPLRQPALPGEVRELQQEGRKLCEFTRLAVDESVRSQAILGAIFHVACIYVSNLHRCSDVLIEVYPAMCASTSACSASACRRGTARPSVNRRPS